MFANVPVAKFFCKHSYNYVNGECLSQHNCESNLVLENGMLVMH